MFKQFQERCSMKNIVLAGLVSCLLIAQVQALEDSIEERFWQSGKKLAIGAGITSAGIGSFLFGVYDKHQLFQNFAQWANRTVALSGKQYQSLSDVLLRLRYTTLLQVSGIVCVFTGGFYLGQAVDGLSLDAKG